MPYRKTILTTVLLTGCCLLLVVPSFAQTWDEWFEQKKTQIQYLEKQIVELGIFIGDLQKGYQIVQKGL